LTAGVGVLACLAAGAAAQGVEWPSWRGVTQDGVSAETGLISSWSPEGENLIWKADFIGRSTPVVLYGQACVIGRVGEGIERQERVACFDAENGQLRWEHRFNVYQTTVPNNRVGWASLVGDAETGNVYAHGVAGQLIAYDQDGKILWSHFLTETHGRLSGYGGRTQTPLVDGDQLIINFVSTAWGKLAPLRHRYYAFDKLSGELQWVSTPGGMPADFNTQSGPVVAEIAGERLLIAGNADGWVYAMRVGTGEKVWGFRLSKRGLNSTVLAQDNRVYASHSEENIDDPTMGRLVAIDATGTGDVTGSHELWRINELAAGFPSPALHQGRLYVVDNSANLHSIDADSGEVHWTHSLGTVGKGSPVIADGKLYATETNGRFHIIQPGVDGAKALDVDELKSEGDRYAEIYGSPAVAYGRIYFATEGGLYCLGDKKKKMKVPAGKRTTPGVAAGKGDAVRVHAVPAVALIRPGESVDFAVHAFDAKGRPLGVQKAEWTVEGLSGRVDANGRFAADKGRLFEAGTVKATAGGLSAEAGVRVMPDLPWSWDFEDFEDGQSPPYWIGASRKYVVREIEGNKVLVKAPRQRGLNRTSLYMGPSSLSNYTIEADVLGIKQGRRVPDIGLIAGGYILDLQGAHQKVQIRSWTSELRMARDIDYPWETGRWYRMKLRVDADEERATIRGKVWPRDEQEPEAWTLTVEDPLPIAGGSPGLVGYSPTDLYYDNIKVTVN
jgi:outer membrane protein assembly factor BamB